MLLKRELNQQVYFFIVHPVGMGGDDRRPRPAASPFHFAALHGENDVVAARITGNDLELRAKHAIQNARELNGVVAWAGAADDHLCGLDVFDLGDFRSAPRHAHANFVAGAAYPAEIRCLELSSRKPEQRVERYAATKRSEYAAVSRRGFGQPICQAQAAGPFHVLWDDGRVARNVLCDMPRQYPGVQIVAAPDAVSDVELDVLALIEVGRGLRECACACGKHQ